MASKPLKFLFAALCGKITIALLKLLKRNATNLPGSVVLTLCPDFLKYLEKPEHIIAVTGTNGKTTVSNMLLEILTDNGYDCTNNNFGGNVDTGITTALLKDSTLSGKATKEYCVLEVDERSALRIYPYVHPDYLICTNLTRDSYKRNAHVEFIFNILNNNIPDKTHLILNADDLISSRLKLNNKRTHFGMEKLEGERLIPDNIIKDMAVCPECSAPLEYDFLRYNHIGRAHCTKCSLTSPSPEYDMTERHFTDDGRAEIIMTTKDGKEDYNVPCENTINLYNAAAVITALRTFGLSHEQIKKSFRKIEVVKSRYEVTEINGCKVVSLLSKGQNPVACSHACNIIRNLEGKTAVVLLLDDFFDAAETSENIAWIHDIDFEFINNENIPHIIVAGKRSEDFVVRLLMAGIPKERIIRCDHESDAGKYVDVSDVNNIYILFDMYNEKYRRMVEEQVKEKMRNAN